MNHPPVPELINVEKVLTHSPATRLLLPFSRSVNRLLRLDRVNEVYRDALLNWRANGNFFQPCLRQLGVTYQVSEEDRSHIPQTGPIVVVSNHPFGAIDGIILGAILEEVRPDFRLLGNHLLEQVEPIRPWLIPVSPFESGRGSTANARGLLACLRWLRQGGALITFPAGEVSHFNFKLRSVRDPEWNSHAISLALRSGASIVPIFFQGRNSLLFQSLGKVHPLLRTAMLGREFTNKTGRAFSLFIGKPIPASRLEQIAPGKNQTRYVRFRTEILANRQGPPTTGQTSLHPPRLRREVRLAEPADPALIAAEIAHLPETTRLFRLGSISVFFCQADQIPLTLREIGRLREVTFRLVGEGTGKALDLDAFDRHYRHLFLWDEAAGKIPGAYRVGLTDEIVPRFGKRGLYTSTLFRLSDRFVESLTPGMELGRSFIVPEYQRARMTLALLWKGIGEIAGREPKYHRLFGPVSISNTYSPTSKSLMSLYLGERAAPGLKQADWVRPRCPFHRRRIFGMERREVSQLLEGVEEISALVSEIESDGKGIPVLLKHYLKMHSTVLSFNVDHEFSNCLDGLIITDLKKTDPKLLRKFLTQESIAAIAAYETGKTAGSSAW